MRQAPLRPDSPGAVSVWLLAARPKTLWASIAPVVIGTAMAFGDGGFHGPAALTALACSVLIQIATNFANDLFDFEKGADTESRQGPVAGHASRTGDPRDDEMRHCRGAAAHAAGGAST